MRHVCPIGLVVTRAGIIVLVRILVSGTLLGSFLLCTLPAKSSDTKRAAEETTPVDIFDTYTGQPVVDWMKCCDCHREKC